MHTDIRNWITETYSKLGKDGVTGLLWGLYHLYLGFWITFTSRYPLGVNVFQREWDVLIVLDACRVDALEAVASEYDFIRSIGSVYSVGSTSSEWITKTFTESHRDKIEHTSYVTGNAYAELILQEQKYPPATEINSISFPVPICSSNWETTSEDDLDSLNIITQTSKKNDGAIKPRPITEAAISAGRKGKSDRIIVHYMQPHRPYIGEDLPPDLRGASITGKLINGQISKQEVWEAYLDTLRYVLDEVEILLENIDADNVVITADHGEGFGEHGSYGHDFGWPHPVEKKVPWAETKATDTGKYVVNENIKTNDDDSTSVEQRLKNLGYINE